MSYLSVSTWSLHRLLGPLRWTAWDAEQRQHIIHEQMQPQEHTLLELPAIAAERGYQAIEVCHFHFPDTSLAYLHRLRDAFQAAGLSFDTLLLDYGDLTSEDEVRRSADQQLMREWIDIASECGAKQIRIVAGEASPDNEQAISLSAEALSSLAAYSAPRGVRVVTENFKPLTSTALTSERLLDLAGEQVGFITDFGNYKGAAVAEEIARTTPRSVSIHAKADFDEAGIPNELPFVRYLEAAAGAGFDGAYVLIYDGPGDMWKGLERVRRIVEPYIH
ncbi:sugar phosphate isomerase/epimerase family protein [Paenibacillus harenae]|uniref:Sugar phosphate isomerase/epimerase n=1 Tax=Paenibacillus harenae TaxID=306543 RepID=A0ABT9TXV5_PAEHA|nr:TIM barrel protein [Paenibacillus harenae]MDQ0111295.1 sugar phosphate isomerase/epimerase [Paenibacillus harenae]